MKRSQQTGNFRKEEVPRRKTYQDKGDGEIRQQEGEPLYIRRWEAEVHSDPLHKVSGGLFVQRESFVGRGALGPCRDSARGEESDAC